MVSIGVQYVLKDMVELHFWLDAPGRGVQWFLMSRTGRAAKRKAYKNPIDPSTGEELVRLNFVESLSGGRGYGVSDEGLRFYREHLAAPRARA